MYPHERSLVKRLANRPFALLGVNSDENLAYAKRRIRAENLTWRSFWNGRQGEQGPISTRWNVQGWPTIYVIDHKGVTRHKNIRGRELDAALEQLIRAAESK